jgi:hypothetical protein
MIVFISRTYQDKQTLSTIDVFNPERKEYVFSCKGLELPWNDNKRRVSCIPEGVYRTVKRHSPRFDNHFHLVSVPNRDWILIHRGNFVREILGCILVGRKHTDIDKDGLLDVTSSVATMNQLNQILPQEFVVVIHKEGEDPMLQFAK